MLKMSWRCLKDDFARGLEDILKTSWRCHSKTYWGRLEDTLKMSWRRVEDVWSRRIYYSWSRSLKDVFWRWRQKTSSRRLHKDEWLLIKSNLSCSLFYKINTRYFSALFEQIRRNNFYISMKNLNSSFFPKTIVEWKKLDSRIQNISSSGLKKHLIKEIKLTSNLSLNIYDPNFLKLITKLRLGLIIWMNTNSVTILKIA